MYEQSFYNEAQSALNVKIDVIGNRTFIKIAKVKGKNNAGYTTYDWKNAIDVTIYDNALVTFYPQVEKVISNEMPATTAIEYKDKKNNIDKKLVFAQQQGRFAIVVVNNNINSFYMFNDSKELMEFKSLLNFMYTPQLRLTAGIIVKTLEVSILKKLGISDTNSNGGGDITSVMSNAGMMDGLTGGNSNNPEINKQTTDIMNAFSISNSQASSDNKSDPVNTNNSAASPFGSLL